MITGYQYEYLYALYLKCMGYSQVTVTKGSGDHGVDVIAYKWPKRYAFQCKFYSSVAIGNRAIQQVLTGAKFRDCDCAIVVTNSTFTKQAIKEAQKVGVTLAPSRTVENLVEVCIKGYKEGKFASDNNLFTHLPAFIQEIIISGNENAVENMDSKFENSKKEKASEENNRFTENTKVNEYQCAYTISQEPTKICAKCHRKYWNNSSTCAVCGCKLMDIFCDLDINDGKDPSKYVFANAKDVDNILREKSESHILTSALNKSDNVDFKNKKNASKKNNIRGEKIKNYTICDKGIYLSNKICTRNFINIFCWFCLIFGFVIFLFSLLILFIDFIWGLSFCMFGIFYFLYGCKLKKVIKLYDSRYSKK